MGGVIELKEKIQSLGEVTFSSSREPTYVALNDFEDSYQAHEFQSTTVNYSQLGQLFRAPVARVSLSSIRVFIGDAYFHTKRTIFRVRIYGVDSVTKAPSKDLCDRPIEVDARHKRIANIDLEQYHIVIPDSSFFVAIEWIKVPETMYEAEQYENRKEEQSYGPSIGLRKTDDEAMVGWIADYRGQWAQFTSTIQGANGMRTTLISAKVRY